MRSGATQREEERKPRVAHAQLVLMATEVFGFSGMGNSFGRYNIARALSCLPLGSVYFYCEQILSALKRIK